MFFQQFLSSFHDLSCKIMIVFKKYIEIGWIFYE